MDYWYCESCKWLGSKSELTDELCCPTCGSEDVFTLRVMRCLECQYMGEQSRFFGGEFFDEEHPVKDLGLTPKCPTCLSSSIAEVTEELMNTSTGREQILTVLREPTDEREAPTSQEYKWQFDLDN